MRILADGPCTAQKLKRVIVSLEKLKGAHTGIISLAIPPGTQIHEVTQMITKEIGTVQNVKSRTNRLNVESALTSVQYRLKQLAALPENGYIIFCGTVEKEDGDVEKVTIDLVPPLPVPRFMYLCDNKIHTEILREMLEQFDGDSFGYIIIDASNVLIARVSGSEKKILSNLSVEPTRKTRRGGQSALRFARLREQTNHEFLKKSCDLILTSFWEKEKNCLNVKGIILAGPGGFKGRILDAELPEGLKKGIVQQLDVAYLGRNGLNEALELTKDLGLSVQLDRERKVLDVFFQRLLIAENMCSYGWKEVVNALRAGAVDTLLINENCDTSYDEEKETIDIDWLLDHHTEFGCKLETVSDNTSEGHQFITGFGGVGALLRYPLVIEDPVADEEEFAF